MFRLLPLLLLGCVSAEALRGQALTITITIIIIIINVINTITITITTTITRRSPSPPPPSATPGWCLPQGRTDRSGWQRKMETIQGC